MKHLALLLALCMLCLCLTPALALENEKVAEGQDGWFFYKLNNSMDIAYDAYPDFDEGAIAALGEAQIRIQKHLAEKGMEYVLVLPPCKPSIYPEYVGDGSLSVISTPADKLADWLEKNSEVKVIRLKEALLAAKPQGQLYYKTDTHWNEVGAYVGFLEIVKKLKEWNLIQADAPEVVYGTEQHKGEFSDMLGDPELLPAEESRTVSVASPRAAMFETGERYEQVKAAVDAAGFSQVLACYANPEVSGPKVLLYGDSMFSGGSLRSLLAELFPEMIFTWDYHVNDGTVDAVKPDLVMFDITERYLNVLFYLNQAYTARKLNDFGSDVQSVKMADQQITAEVKNTSSAAWSEVDMVRLALMLDGADTGIRAALPLGTVVKKGESFAFVFTAQQLEQVSDRLAGSKVEVQMVQDGVTYFGEKLQLKK